MYAEKDKKDKELSEHDVECLCGASEDYEAHKEQCDKLYDMLDKGIIKDDPDFEYDLLYISHLFVYKRQSKVQIL